MGVAHALSSARERFQCSHQSLGGRLEKRPSQVVIGGGGAAAGRGTLIRPVKSPRARKRSGPPESARRKNGRPARLKALREGPSELWDKYLRTRWRKHRNLLVEEYLPLVRNVAEQVSARLPRSVDSEDMISAGVFGLLQCIDNFDPERGTRFESFCRMRIRGAMIDELRSQDLLSRDARERANRVAGARQRLLQDLGREPSSHEVAQEIGLTPREVDESQRKAAAQNPVSLERGALDAALGDDLGGGLPDNLIDAHLEPPEAAHRKDLLLLIEESLTEAERDIVNLRYRDGMTLRHIGRALGISESRVCQLHGSLLGRLHRMLATED